MFSSGSLLGSNHRVWDARRDEATRLVVGVSLVVASVGGFWNVARADDEPHAQEVAKVAQWAGSGLSSGLQGRVHNEVGQPLVGVLVSVFGSGLRGGGAVAFTDEAGLFRLPEVPPGVYVLHAYLAGFLPFRSREVEVAENGLGASGISMGLTAASGEEQGGGSEAEAGAASGRTDELKWLLRRAARNILRHRQDRLETDAEDEVPERALVATVESNAADIGGEVGFVASEDGISSFPGAGAGLDARMAYARLELPGGREREWLLSAQLLESTLSSWAAQAELVSGKGSDGELTTGLSYGNHFWGGLDEFRPPEAALQHRQSNDRTREWFGSAFGRHRLRWGDAHLTTGLSYHHFSYLERSNYLAPRLQLEWEPAEGTALRWNVDYRILAPGGEDLALLARMVAADTAGVTAPGTLRAERTLHQRVGVERQLDTLGAIEFHAFQEDADDQLLKAYRRGAARQAAGGYQLSNSGDYRTRGVGLTWSRRFGALQGKVDYTYGRATVRSASAGVAREGETDEIHDLVTTLETEIDRTGTRLLAIYRLTSPFAASAESGALMNGRYNVQVHQALPVPGDTVEWELLVAIRNLFYENPAMGSFLDELMVVDSPRRVLGGLAVRF